MRLFNVKIYRYFLLLCIVGILWFGGNCYLNALEKESVAVSATDRAQVYASGKIIGIYEQTAGVLVVDTAMVKDKENNECFPTKGKLKSGDYINSIDGKDICRKEDIVKLVENSNGKSMLINFNRGNKVHNVRVTPIMTSENKYAIGLWVKDDMAGIGTMTCYDSNGNFIALGHGIGNGTNGELLSVQNGCIYDMDLSGVTKGEKGVPGELSGIIYYGRKTKLGVLNKNCDLGIYGTLEDEELKEYTSCDIRYEIAYKKEIKKDRAFILSGISGRIEKYDIEIIDTNCKAKDENKGIYIKVTDERLLEKSGGIVQGMSGSPIIQDGRIIGAVTHVLVNDPTRGYGIFIEKMLENK